MSQRFRNQRYGSHQGRGRHDVVRHVQGKYRTCYAFSLLPMPCDCLYNKSAFATRLTIVPWVRSAALLVGNKSDEQTKQSISRRWSAAPACHSTRQTTRCCAASTTSTTCSHKPTLCDRSFALQVVSRTGLPQYACQNNAVVRRFRDFDALHERLGEAHRGAILPPLPEKSAVQKFQMTNEFIEQRRRALQARL